MPRRVYTYAPRPRLERPEPGLVHRRLHPCDRLPRPLHTTSSGACARERSRATNPWGAWTLEWATTSPPPHGNFSGLPQIHSERPLWDDGARLEVDGRVGQVQWTDLPHEPEQRTITPFWVAFGILIIGIGLLGARLVFVVGVLLLLITLAVWMNGRWTERADAADVGRRALLVHRRRHAGLHRLGVGLLRLAHRRRHPPAHPQHAVGGGTGVGGDPPAGQHRSSCSPAASPRTSRRPRTARGARAGSSCCSSSPSSSAPLPRRPALGVHALGLRLSPLDRRLVLLRAHRVPRVARALRHRGARLPVLPGAPRAAAGAGRAASSPSPRPAPAAWSTPPRTTGTSSTPCGWSSSSSSTCSSMR